MDRSQSRRGFLATVTTISSASLAGCRSPGTAHDSGGETGETPTSQRTGKPGDCQPGEDALDLSHGDYETVYEAVSPSVSNVRVYDGNGGTSQGSAFVYDDSRLLTNEHVIRGAESVSVRFGSMGWRGVTVLAADVYSDLAVLEMPALPNGGEPLPFVDSEAAIGTEVMAIGNPFGFSGSVSAGIVSGVDRTLPAANGFSIPNAVQTDAGVNPGNSGGPLVTLDGDVVGVVNAGGGDNIGFAISAALTRRVVPELIQTGEFEHSYVGVTLQQVTPSIAKANEMNTAEGIYIDEVIGNGPSDGVLYGTTGREVTNGVETPVGGDIVVAIDEAPIPTRQALSTYLALEVQPGDTVSVRVHRDGEVVTESLELGTRPEPGF